MAHLESSPGWVFKRFIASYMHRVHKFDDCTATAKETGLLALND